MDLYRLAWCSCAPNVAWLSGRTVRGVKKRDSNFRMIVDDQSCGSDAFETGLLSIWVFPKIGVPQNGWFMMENPIKVDALGVPLFLETPISFGSFCFFFHSSPFHSRIRSLELLNFEH